jgi:hypothetical protein
MCRHGGGVDPPAWLSAGYLEVDDVAVCVVCMSWCWCGVCVRGSCVCVCVCMCVCGGGSLPPRAAFENFYLRQYIRYLCDLSWVMCVSMHGMRFRGSGMGAWCVCMV